MSNGGPYSHYSVSWARQKKPLFIELRADSPLWWGFGVVTVLRTPDLRFCGTQFPSVASAMGDLKSYLLHTASPTCPLDRLEAEDRERGGRQPP